MQNILFTLSSWLLHSLSLSLIWSVSFLFPTICSVLSLYLISSMEEQSISWSINVEGLEVGVLMVLDTLSLLFMITVSVVSLMVLIYSVDYMRSEGSKKKFMVTMVIFIISMLLLAFSGSLFWLLVGWDGLGLSSFLLITFYQNWKSYSGAMITFMVNRLGDCFLLSSLLWMMTVMPYSWECSSKGVFSVLVMGGAFTKSAQVPFSAWLPVAMAAPTPVSSLVHSSTLVTAGVYLLIRFHEVLEDLSQLIFVLASMTIVLAGLSSVGEMDTKKVVALSTLSHVGMMIVLISVGSLEGAMLHLMMHGFFKSLLFMVVGDLIHLSWKSQDVRKLSLSVASYPLGVCFLLSLMSMMGLPFLSGFISKEMMFSMVMSGKMVEAVMFIMGVLMTSSYSVRLIIYLMKSTPLTSLPIQSSNSGVYVLMGTLSCLGGCIVLNWSLFRLESSVLLYSESNLILFLGIFLGSLFSVIGLNRGGLVHWFFQEMWLVMSFTILSQVSIMTASIYSMMKMDYKGNLSKILSDVSDSLSLSSVDKMKLFFNPLLLVEEVSVALLAMYVLT